VKGCEARCEAQVCFFNSFHIESDIGPVFGDVQSIAYPPYDSHQKEKKAESLRLALICVPPLEFTYSFNQLPSTYQNPAPPFDPFRRALLASFFFLTHFLLVRRLSRFDVLLAQVGELLDVSESVDRETMLLVESVTIHQS